PFDQLVSSRPVESRVGNSDSCVFGVQAYRHLKSNGTAHGDAFNSSSIDLYIGGYFFVSRKNLFLEKFDPWLLTLLSSAIRRHIGNAIRRHIGNAIRRHIGNAFLDNSLIWNR